MRASMARLGVLWCHERALAVLVHPRLLPFTSVGEDSCPGAASKARPSADENIMAVSAPRFTGMDMLPKMSVQPAVRVGASLPPVCTSLRRAASVADPLPTGRIVIARMPAGHTLTRTCSESGRLVLVLTFTTPVSLP